MSQVLVCGRWSLELTEGEGGYYQYINKRAGEVGRNAHCILHLLEQCGAQRYTTVSEPFGGVGVFATVIQGFCRPDVHRIYEIDTDCLRQLSTAFKGRRGVEVAEGDAHDTIGNMRAELHMLDFPFFTALHLERWRPELERLFASEPKLVIVMDGASFGMHWHAQRYADFFGREVRDNQDYAEAMAARIQADYGYAITAATVSRGCFYFAFVPGPLQEFRLRPFTTAGLALRPNRVLLT